MFQKFPDMVFLTNFGFWKNQYGIQYTLNALNTVNALRQHLLKVSKKISLHLAGQSMI